MIDWSVFGTCASDTSHVTFPISYNGFMKLICPFSVNLKKNTLDGRPLLLIARQDLAHEIPRLLRNVVAEGRIALLRGITNGGLDKVGKFAIFLVVTITELQEAFSSDATACLFFFV